MNRRSFLAGLVIPLSAAAFLAACGDDAGGDRPDIDGTDPTTIPPTTAAPVPTAAPSTAPATIRHATGADDVVLELSYEGGFVPANFFFVRLPRVLVTGDGSVYTQGAQIKIFPQPLLAPVLVGKITEARLQALLADASEADLFRDITYASRNDIADAPDTVLVINVNGASYTHSAYALGFDPKELDADRQAFVDYVGILDALAAEDLASVPFAADQYAIMATPEEQAGDPGDGIVPNEIAWPSGTGVTLVTAAECQVVQASTLGTTFAEATQITRFIDAGQKFVLAVRPMLPGDVGC